MIEYGAENVEGVEIGIGVLLDLLYGESGKGIPCRVAVIRGWRIDPHTLKTRIVGQRLGMLGQLQSNKPWSALLEDVLQIRGRVVARVDEVNVYAWPENDLVRYCEEVV